MSSNLILKQPAANNRCGGDITIRSGTGTGLSTISEKNYMTHKLHLDNICERCGTVFSVALYISMPPTIYSSCGNLSCNEFIIKDIIE